MSKNLSLFYLHGLGGTPSDWRGVLSELPGDALALPEMDRPDPDRLASLWASEIRKKSPTAFSLCGYSMGGRLAILTAEQLVKSHHGPRHLILLSAGLGFENHAERKKRALSDSEWAKIARSDPDFWTKWYAQDLFSSFRALAAPLKEGWLNSRKDINSSSLSAQFEFLGPSQHVYLLPKLRFLKEKNISVLYIVGELDKKYLELANFLESEKLADVKRIPGAGHILPLEAPRAVTLAIKEFIKGA